MPFNQSIVMIAQTGDKDDINTMLGQLRAFGPESLSAPLYDAGGNVTHYGFRADMEDNFSAQWTEVTSEAAQGGLITTQRRNQIRADTLIDAVQDVRLSSSPYEQFAAAAAGLGLTVYDPTTQ